MSGEKPTANALAKAMDAHIQSDGFHGIFSYIFVFFFDVFFNYFRQRFITGFITLNNIANAFAHNYYMIVFVKNLEIVFI